VAAFHVRDIPPEQLEKLRERARLRGRSMNAEVLAMLDQYLAHRTPEEVLASIRAGHRRFQLPPDAPRPEDIIREDRDSDHGRL
jgi:plasmid stability protein